MDKFPDDDSIIAIEQEIEDFESALAVARRSIRDVEERLATIDVGNNEFESKFDHEQGIGTLHVPESSSVADRLRADDLGASNSMHEVQVLEARRVPLQEAIDDLSFQLAQRRLVLAGKVAPVKVQLESDIRELTKAVDLSRHRLLFVRERDCELLNSISTLESSITRDEKEHDRLADENKSLECARDIVLGRISQMEYRAKGLREENGRLDREEANKRKELAKVKSILSNNQNRVNLTQSVVSSMELSVSKETILRDQLEAKCSVSRHMLATETMPALSAREMELSAAKSRYSGIRAVLQVTDSEYRSQLEELDKRSVFLERLKLSVAGKENYLQVQKGKVGEVVSELEKEQIRRDCLTKRLEEMRREFSQRVSTMSYCEGKINSWYVSINELEQKIWLATIKTDRSIDRSISGVLSEIARLECGQCFETSVQPLCDEIIHEELEGKRVGIEKGLAKQRLATLVRYNKQVGSNLGKVKSTVKKNGRVLSEWKARLGHLLVELKVLVESRDGRASRLGDLEKTDRETEAELQLASGKRSLALSELSVLESRCVDIQNEMALLDLRRSQAERRKGALDQRIAGSEQERRTGVESLVRLTERVGVLLKELGNVAKETDFAEAKKQSVGRRVESLGGSIKAAETELRALRRRMEGVDALEGELEEMELDLKKLQGERTSLEKVIDVTVASRTTKGECLSESIVCRLDRAKGRLAAVRERILENEVCLAHMGELGGLLGDTFSNFSVQSVLGQINEFKQVCARTGRAVVAKMVELALVEQTAENDVDQ